MINLRTVSAEVSSKPSVRLSLKKVIIYNSTAFVYFAFAFTTFLF
jgi:hypothetical protein